RNPRPWNPGPGNKHCYACTAAVTCDGACAHVILEGGHTGRHRGRKQPPVRQSVRPDTPEIFIKPGRCPVNKDLINTLSVQAAGLTPGSSAPRESVPTIDPKSVLTAHQHSLFSARQAAVPPADQKPDFPAGPENKAALKKNNETTSPDDLSSIIRQFHSTAVANAETHSAFLEFSQKNTTAFEKQFKTLVHLGNQCTETSFNTDTPSSAYTPLPAESPSSANRPSCTDTPSSRRKEPLFTREMCMEFATGKAANVLGQSFEIVDSYPVRVRLPNAPLMLVDRIMSIKGEMLSLTSGEIVTQHDVTQSAWYLDGGKAPVCISIEAGQADLFLSSFLGIDHRVKGKRKYRLLDAKVTFHRTLPEPDETIEYHIKIDRFLKQGDVYLFFFHYRGYISNALFISMRDGCAGFFTDREVTASGGIILKKEEMTSAQADIFSAEKNKPGQEPAGESYSDEKIAALRKGRLDLCFGPEFKDVTLGKELRLPGGRMHLIDRVLSLDLTGGRYHKGAITAEADIRPDAWFLTCHFIDDMVMPGTLMYECCAHALRIFTQRLGWVFQDDRVHYDIIPGLESDLKCRGPVTPKTRKARYYIEIKDIKYTPEPCITADAHMFSDDLRIVLYKNMGMKISGIPSEEMKDFRDNHFGDRQ
ncbi:MAG: hypothetical protein R6U68_02675, partial [Desulfobacteraceae bacterium]